MKRPIAKIVSLLLLATFCICLLPVQANAAQGSCGQHITWFMDETGKLTISGSGSMNDFTETECPWDRSKVTEVVINSGITSIGAYAFQGCINLLKVTVSSSVTQIGAYAFQGCEKLSEIALPEGVLEIGEYCFADCHYLDTLQLPQSLQRIGSRAFQNCYRLSRVVLPDKLQLLGEQAFASCKALTEISLPLRDTNISKNVFAYTGLTEIAIPEGWKRIPEGMFAGCTALDSVQLPEGLTTIGDTAFAACYLLTDITLPATLEAIGKAAFSACISLTAIHIPDGVHLIDDGTFSGCTSLASVTIGPSVTGIGEAAFAQCAIEQLTLPVTLTRIYDSAFSECNKLTSITYLGTQGQWDSIQIGSDNRYLESAALSVAESTDPTQTPTEPTSQEPVPAQTPWGLIIVLVALGALLLGAGGMFGALWLLNKRGFFQKQEAPKEQNSIHA